MALNFNVDPYYDDFDPSKNFHRILFKPGYAVQARELTQSQTILQNQISSFADAIFSQNTPVSGGRVSLNFAAIGNIGAFFVKLQTQYSGVDIDVNNFLNKDIQDSNGIVRARVVAVSEGTIADPPTLVVSYYSGAKFNDASTITCSDGSNFSATTIGTNPLLQTCTGASSTASISNGVFYVINGYNTSNVQNPDGTYNKYSIGNFISVLPQTIILDKYSSSPSGRVGLSITETIVDYIDDPSLLDPAVGASNYQAPGADRFKISLELVVLPLTPGNDDQFIELVRLENGKILKQVDGTVYSVIDDYFAKRTYESDGDFIVNEFRFTPTANTVNQDLYDLKVSKGLAYVRGYRIENQSDIVLTTSRARSNNIINNNQVYVDYGSYVLANNVSGTFDITTMPKIDLHCVANSNIVSTNSVTYSATLVGSAFLRNIDYESSLSDSNTSTYSYKMYITDVSANTLSGTALAAGSSATTIQFNDTNGKFSAVANAYFGVKISALTSGYTDVREIVSYDGSTKTATVNSPFTLNPTNLTTFNLLFSTADIESLVNVPNGPATPTVRTASANIPNAGKFNGLSTGDTLLYNPNQPELLFTVGYPYVSNISDSSYVSQKVFRSKSFTSSGGNFVLTLSLPVNTANIKFIGTGTLSSDAIKQNFIVVNQANRQVLDFVSSGNTVVISSDQKTATFTTPAYGTVTVDVIAGVSVGNADNSTLVLKAKNLVVGNTQIVSYAGPTAIVASNTYLDLTNGQVYINQIAVGKTTSLYVSDVKKIRKIITTKSSATVPTTAMLTDSSYDVTNLFLLDNGQRDTYYDFAAIRLKPGASKPLGNLLVIFDYYAHTGGDGYFDVNSYLTPISSSPDQYREIGNYTSKAGINYRFTDSLDFRPARQAPSGSVSSVPFVLEYTGNPSAPDDSGILIPQNLSYFTHDYSYYLGRKDKLILTKDRSITIIEGTPSVNPVFPTEPDGALILAKMTLDPYTGYIPGEDTITQQSNYSIEKVQHKNWIKQDITDLQDRVNNLEYYTALSLLEQNAQSLQIPDSNGLNRFKNGILVDDFSSFATADTRPVEGFNAKIDIAKKQLLPKSVVDNLALKNPIVLNSLGTLKQTNSFYVHTIAGGTNIYTLPYGSANIAAQTLASSTVSVNPFGVIRNEGTLELSPPMDNWIDNQQAPDILVADPRLQLFQSSGTNIIQNAGNWQTIPGTTSQVLSGTATTVTTAGNIQTTTTTQTFNVFGSQLQNVTNSGYSAINSTIGLNNGYITNIGVLGYIRPQRIRFKASGMLSNAKMKAFFDGVNVTKHIVSPNVIRVENVSGVFREDDIVGFETAGIFYPLGRVLGVSAVPGSSTSFNLTIFDLDGAPEYIADSVIQNGRFNENGIYVTGSSTASGQLSNGVSPLAVSGVIRGVGGSFVTNANTNANLVFRSTRTDAAWGDFLKVNGMWATSNNVTAYRNWDATYTFTANTTGNYVLTASSWRDTTAPFINRTATITIDGTVRISASELYSATPTGIVSKTISLTPGNHTIRITANGTGTATQSGLACTLLEPVGTPGRNIVFNALYPPSVDYPSGSQIVMPLGGAYYDGFTRLALCPLSSTQDDFYVGSTITITTKYLYTYLSDGSAVQLPVPLTSGGAGDGGITVGNRTYVGPDGRTGYVLQSIETYTANIIDYDGQLKVATLDAPVNISLGDNQLFGNINSTYSIKGALVSVEEAIIDGTTVPSFSTDAQGTISGLFEIPPSTFRNGERIFRIDNRTVDTDPTTATSYSEATFTASGLSVLRQRLDFAPSVDSSGKTFISVNQRSGAFVGTSQQVTVTQQVINTGGWACCFIAGTKITMADGSEKNIEDVEIDDYLLGKDGSINKVLDFVRPLLGDRTLISLNGSVPFITNDHPVYMKDGTWKSFDPEATKRKYKKLSDWNIGKLEIGDVIETGDNEGFKIESMSEHSDREDLQVYNFSLDGNHTYIANNLVVHNKCFVAGTEVLMKDNTWKNIEDVELNDVLIGENGSENRVREFHRPTLGLMDHVLPHKLRLASINNSDFSVSEDHMIKTTSGWRTPTVEMCKILHAKTLETENIDITQLQLGDDIICSDGSLMRVESIVFKEDAPEIQLYNFRLYGNKTYHVRMKGSDKFILVHNKCFTSGTEVLMSDGSWKNIEDVELGDVLIGEDGAENAVKEFHRPVLGLNDHILPHKLRLASINGSSFSVSEDHMIKTTSGWRTPTVEACKILHAETLKNENIDITQLQLGDEIICSDGSTFKVESIDFKEDNPELQLYNFKLHGNKTYHVRMKGTDKFMLVHNKDPLAQTFIVPIDNYPNGAFLRSIKIFFKSKPTIPNAPGVELFLVGTLNGYPNGKTLDYSIARRKASEVNVSDNPHYLDPATATEFVFPAPVYIQPNVLYSFIVISPSPDYVVYYGQQNAIAVPSTTKARPTDPNPANPGKIGASPYIGGLFESQNAITWQVDQSKQMMFVIDQCVFTTSDAKTIEFSLPSGLPYRAIDAYNDILHTTSPISVNNTYGNFSQKVPTMRSDAVNITTTDFTPTGTTIAYTASSTLNDGANTVVGPVPAFPGRLGSPTYEDIDYDDGKGPRVLLRDANNSFRLFATMITADANTSPIISDDGVSLYNIRYVINNLELSNSMIEIVDGGTGYISGNVSATVSAPDIGSDTASCGVDVTSNVITNVYLTSYGSGYIKTPTITITGSNTSPATVVVRGETSASGGNLTTARYLTKVVKLSPENESGDLRVFYTAYKPLGTEIYVYYKILNADDTDVIEDKDWQLMTQVNQVAYSLSKQNLIEFECAPGINNQPDNFISYTKETETYNSFNQFQIKVVMTTEDTSIIPFVTDVRALALPSGTGL